MTVSSMGDIYNIPEVSVATSLMNYVMVEQTDSYYVSGSEPKTIIQKLRKYSLNSIRKQFRPNSEAVRLSGALK